MDSWNLLYRNQFVSIKVLKKTIGAISTKDTQPTKCHRRILLWPIHAFHNGDGCAWKNAIYPRFFRGFPRSMVEVFPENAAGHCSPPFLYAHTHFPPFFPGLGSNWPRPGACACPFVRGALWVIGVVTQERPHGPLSSLKRNDRYWKAEGKARENLRYGRAQLYALRRIGWRNWRLAVLLNFFCMESLYIFSQKIKIYFFNTLNYYLFIFRTKWKRKTIGKTMVFGRRQLTLTG